MGMGRHHVCSSPLVVFSGEKGLFEQRYNKASSSQLGLGLGLGLGYNKASSSQLGLGLGLGLGYNKAFISLTRTVCAQASC